MLKGVVKEVEVEEKKEMEEENYEQNGNKDISINNWI